MRRIRLATFLIVVSLAASCTSPPRAPSASLQAAPVAPAYRDPTGWSIEIPLGWYMTPFHLRVGRLAARGAQISNVPLPSPVFGPRAAPQADGATIPSRAVALVVAVDSDPRRAPLPIRSLPIRFQDFVQGSALAGSPMIAVASFHDHGRIFVITIKFGARAYNARQLRIVDRLLRSLR